MLLALLVVLVVLVVVLPIIGATVFSIVQALLVGLLLGLVARMIAPGKGKIGLGTTALVGFAGGLIGRVLARVVYSRHHSHRFGELLLELLATVVLVLVVRASTSGAGA